MAIVVQEKNIYTTLNALYLSKQYPAALESIKNYLTNFPQSFRRDEILYKLGDTYRQLNQTSEALATFDQLLISYPRSPYRPYALLRKAELQSPQKSLPLLQEVIQTASNTGLRLNAQFQTIQTLQKLNRDSEAIPLLKNLLKTKTNNPYLAYAHLALGVWEQKQNNLADALDHFREALTLADTPAMRGEAGVRAGSVALTLKQWKEATALFETVRRLEIPENWLQLANLGLLRAQYYSKDYEAVIATYNTFHNKFSAENRDEILYYLANSFRFSQKNDLALQAYETLLTKNKNLKNSYRQAAHYEKLLILAEKSKPNFLQEAASFLQNYPNTPESDTIRYLLAKFYFDQKKIPEAIPLFETILQQHQPKNFLELACYQLAWSYLFLSQDQQAIKTFESFLEQFPQSPYASESRWQIALAQERLGQLEPALIQLENLLTHYPKSPEAEKALLRKGILLHQQKKFVESLQTLSAFLDQYQNSTNAPTAQFYRGLNAFEQKDYPVAIADLSAVRDNSQAFYPPSTERLLLSNYYLNQPEKVNDYLQDLDALPSQIWSPPAELLFWLAEYYQKKKDWAKAETFYQRAQQNTSSDLQQRAQLNLGFAQLEQKKFSEAIQTLKPLRKTAFSQSPELLLALAQANLGDHQLATASQLAEHIMRNFPEGEFNAKARLVLAKTLMKQKQFAEAAKYYSSVALLYDDTNLTLLALKQAAEAYRQAGNLEEAKRLETDYQKRLSE
ncbi:MAG: tetratricopeptide repeat protein [Verrucomicrobiae bacterium]|nr:tetratricopeptide repeat protein [Verrucomicrobiae bacterium]